MNVDFKVIDSKALKNGDSGETIDLDTVEKTIGLGDTDLIIGADAIDKIVDSNDNKKIIDLDAIEKIMPRANWRDNGEAPKMDRTTPISEKAYINTTDKIIDASVKQLNRQFHTKNKLKISFTKFFMWFISIQYVFMICIFVGKAFFAPDFPDNIILTYIGSVFVETLGAIIIMIKHAFDSNQEVRILDILNGAISKYQK